MRFLGNIEARTDNKGRAFLPAQFRKILQCNGEERLVLRKDVFQPCLVLYPESVWNMQLDTLRKRLSPWNKPHQQVFRQFISDVEPLSIDGNGRFLIPKRYMKVIGMTQEIRFIGMDETIEIWDAAKTEEPFMDLEDFGKAIERLMNTDEDIK
ncbi:division/cell wall cluster transcriptional repressor MraZ [Xylanibacter muris]|uniref:Transcriptional regulator MraZ n=1 Tax=Xylanibacter muris TaxID=2736290 RepID=A0ABX2ARB8_9BACT|nr:division/cell wall cluster transcriptional repressor MraZ [Xylanibacter muris]NPD92587.1 division/cell wall cluster transcriptional repressor MraZ [Xylanibacter muris]